MNIRITKTLTATVAAIGIVAPLAGAQPIAAGPRWQAWAGCWTAVSNAVAWDSNNGAPPTMCVVPTSDANAVDIVTLVSGKVVGRNRIDASGQSHALTANGCTGSEQSRFSADGKRVFLRSTVDCQGSATQTSALLAITSSGDWIDVRSVASGGASSVKVARYRESGIPRDLPAELNAAFAQPSPGLAGARVASSAPFSNDAVIEALKFVDAGVVEGWIMESGQRFAMDSWSLAQLADAGVPGSITDAMIQASNPRRASGDRVYGQGRYVAPYGRGASDGWNQDTGERIIVTAYPAYDPWGFGWGYGYPLGYYAGYGRYGYGSAYSIGYGPSYGLGYGYGFGFGSGYYRRGLGYYYPPVVVLHQTSGGGGGQPHGQAVKGGGYTQGRTATPTTPAPSSGTTASAPPAPGSSPAPPSAPAQPASNTGGRTAKGRP